MKKHPSNNMGAETHPSVLAPSENRGLIDWLAFTFKDVSNPDDAIKRANLEDLDFIESACGGMGYKAAKRAGNIVVYYDGNSDMGCHISMTGQGCRQFEAMGIGSAKTHQWYSYLHYLRSVNASFSRLDIAIDNIDGDLDLDKLLEHIDSNQVRTRFKGGHLIRGFSFDKEPKDPGKTIYLGSRQSRLKIRFYDKAAEQKTTDGVPWARCELQCMGERAQEMVKNLLRANCEFGEIATAALNQYFTPLEGDNTRNENKIVASWWSKWLITVDKIRLSRSKAIRLVPEVMDHIMRQYSTSIAMISKYLSYKDFTNYTKDLIKFGTDNMKKKHHWILESSKLSEILTCNVLETTLPF